MGGEVRAAEGLERQKVLVAELVYALGRFEILERVVDKAAPLPIPACPNVRRAAARVTTELRGVAGHG